MSKVLSFADIDGADDIEYDTVPVFGGLVQIGSLNSEDMIEWLEANEDAAKKKEAGLRLIVKSVVDEDKQRVPKDQFEAMLAKFRKKSAVSNGKLVAGILKLNGMKAKAAEIKNESGGTDAVASPAVSPSAPGA